MRDLIYTSILCFIGMFASYTFLSGLIEYFNMEPVIAIVIASIAMTMAVIFSIFGAIFFIIIPAIWGAYVAWDWNILGSILLFAIGPIVFGYFIETLFPTRRRFF
ncbi:hypothetical protein IJZ97_05785 [bacterium]|nr:hypothetical protein [bacterium]